SGAEPARRRPVERWPGLDHDPRDPEPHLRLPGAGLPDGWRLDGFLGRGDAARTSGRRDLDRKPLGSSSGFILRTWSAVALPHRQRGVAGTTATAAIAGENWRHRDHDEVQALPQAGLSAVGAQTTHRGHGSAACTDRNGWPHPRPGAD